MEREYRRTVRAPADVTLEAIDAAAEMWNAAWETAPDGGRLHLPVLAGIRRGRVLGRIRVRESGSSTEVVLEVEHSEYELNRPATVFLVLGALGALVMLLLPFFPVQLAGLMPLSLILLLGAWLVVASRLRSASPVEFLDTVAELVEDDDPEAPEIAAPPGG